MAHEILTQNNERKVGEVAKLLSTLTGNAFHAKPSSPPRPARTETNQ